MTTKKGFYELRCLVCDWTWTSDYSQQDCPHCGAVDIYAEENSEQSISKYKLVSVADANDQQELESVTESEALAEALNTLGYQLVQAD